MSILQDVPNSILWLLVDGQTARKNLHTEAERHGVPSSRLVFAEKVGREQHAARLSMIDLQLDTFPYTAHTTASDALWAECPIVTLIGESFPSRVCASILTTNGVSDLIASDWTDYREKAVNLARNPLLLTQFRKRIRHGNQNSPLFDISRYCQNLERAYQKMMATYAAGDQPAEIDVRNLV